MEQKLEQIEEKVEKLVTVLEALKAENRELKMTNQSLTSQIQGFEKQIHKMQLDDADRSETVRTRLEGLLGRLDELEHIGG